MVWRVATIMNNVKLVANMLVAMRAATLMMKLSHCTLTMATASAMVERNKLLR